ncbi:MAG TPA: histidine phosphatase family protein [Amnibacterium sp.]|uniref:histidine phosphatase family protein n=1 Tax=Amnibacterium sp. TaxID=1872496 RepID=UPI002F92494A
MVARALHLVRHGEVHNPAGVIYGRLPEFRLSDRGERMAARTAESLADLPITRIVASPLLRTQQSAQPIAEIFGLPVESDERVIESGNALEGRVSAGTALFRDPRDWRLFVNPLRPSWGEPYTEIVERMRRAIFDVFASTDDGDVVIVTHQLPIWMVHRSMAGEPLPHDPRHRRCALSSVTSVARRDGRLAEIAYTDPAAGVAAVDQGAS